MNANLLSLFAGLSVGVFVCGCVETEYPASEWTLSPGEQVTFPALQERTLDVVRLVVPETGTYELALRDCNAVDARLYQNDDVRRSWMGGRIEVELTSTSRNVVAVDRSGQPTCIGPLIYERVVDTEEVDAGAVRDSGAITDVNERDARTDADDPPRVSCQRLSAPENGEVATPDGVQEGDVATYTCDTGYTRSSGSETRTCQSNGQWSGREVLCADTNECVQESVCTAAGNSCKNLEGTWECVCAQGYEGGSVMGRNASCEQVELPPIGQTCASDEECPSNSWCSTVSGFRRCSPRVFSGTAHQMDFVFVPSGTFQQGTPGATNEERPYTATISRNYFVSRTEVTQGQWKAATGGRNPSCFQTTTGTSCSLANANDNGPVESVSWYSAVAYANWLSVNQGFSPCYSLAPSTCADTVSDWAGGDTACTGVTFSGVACTGFRLLAESEWERAARGGTTSKYFWGEATDAATAGLYGWLNDNSGRRAQAVGGKSANPYGLFDMVGNVEEFAWDWAHGCCDWLRYPETVTIDYIGPGFGSARSVRGGSFANNVWDTGSARRGKFGLEAGSARVGIRLARTAN